MKKSMIFFYGIICYLIFLVAFLYAIGFVGNIIVPKSIDSGADTSLITAIIVNALLLSAFAVQHSIMARLGFKKIWTKIIGVVMERSTFVLFTSLLLILIYWQWRPITSIVWKVENNIFSTILNVVYYLGWFIVLISTFMVSHFDLFGLKQVYTNLVNIQYHHPKFQINYFYTFVRHPIMLGFIIAFWATPVMTLGHLIFSIATTLYIIIAVKYLEEKDLITFFGESYKEYQKKVPMLVPFIIKKS